jgi:hypothetical protein
MPSPVTKPVTSKSTRSSASTILESNSLYNPQIHSSVALPGHSGNNELTLASAQSAGAVCTRDLLGDMTWLSADSIWNSMVLKLCRT